MKKQLLPYSIFLQHAKSFYKLYRDEYILKIKKAGKEFKRGVHIKYKDKIYKDHHEVQATLDTYKHFVSETIIEAGEEGIDYSSFFNQKIKSIKNADQLFILLNLGKLQGLNEVIDFVTSKSNKYYNEADLSLVQPFKPSEIKSSVYWKGTTKVHFIQLIYALYHTKNLTNDENQITALVEQVAKFFNLELGKSWQSLLSDSVNNRSANYESSFFKTLADSYNTLSEKKIKKNEGKRPQVPLK